MEPIVIRHALGAYPVQVRTGSLGSLAALLAQAVPARRLALITDEAIVAAVPAVRTAAQWDAELVVPPGEQSKTRETWAHLTDQLLAKGFGRDSALVGIGGGVVGDLTGFAAATYHRGIPYILVPTTLLAMLDASVGGKTGVDTPQGKNLIGAFHPPAAVLADPALLATLPVRDYRAGLAEAVKHGLIADAKYFAWIGSVADRLLTRNTGALERLVHRSVEIKAAVVMEDEREAGRRATLNAGHTVAHALEVLSSYTLPHGEAVALGLVAECAIGEQLGETTPGTAHAVGAMLTRLGLPVRIPFAIDPAAALEAMQRDKKNRAGRIHCAFVAKVGEAPSLTGKWTTAVAEGELVAGVGRIG